MKLSKAKFKLIQIIGFSLYFMFTAIFFQNCSKTSKLKGLTIGAIGNDSNCEGPNCEDASKDPSTGKLASKVNYCMTEDKKNKAPAQHLVRISKSQYSNMISDLIPSSYNLIKQDLKILIDNLPEQSPVYSFNGYSTTKMSSKRSASYYETAGKISKYIIQDTNIQKLCKNKENNGWDHCAKSISLFVVNRLFRRPIRPYEENRISELYEKTYDFANKNIESLQKKSSSFFTTIESEALEAILQNILMSQAFLYKTEFLENGFNETEKNYKKISLLAFSLLNSFPSEDLLIRAAQPEPITEKELISLSENILLNKPERFITNFVQHWLGLNGKVFDESKIGNLALETYKVFEEQLKLDLKVGELLKPGFTYVNSYLSNIYEIGTSSTGLNDFKKVSSINRGGLLAQAAILNTERDETNPIKRGAWTINSIMCKTMPELNQATISEITEALKNIPSELNPSEKLKLHSSRPDCKTCHKEIDPIGITLEEFDEKGSWRSRYPSGKKVIIDEVIDNTRIKKYADLVEFLNKDQVFAQCLMKKVKAFAFSSAPLLVKNCEQPNESNINNTGIRSLISQLISRGIIEIY